VQKSLKGREQRALGEVAVTRPQTGGTRKLTRRCRETTTGTFEGKLTAKIRKTLVVTPTLRKQQVPSHRGGIMVRYGKEGAMGTPRLSR